MGWREWLIDKLTPPEPEYWQVIGWVDAGWTLSNRSDKKSLRDVQSRSILKVSENGRREVIYGFESILQGVAKQHLHEFWGKPVPTQLKAWENGGPLPDGFTHANIGEPIDSRKPAKRSSYLRLTYRR